MGVSGSGKTTIGERLAGRLGGTFFDADRFHPPENVARMARGEPLTDAERQPWLERLRDEVVAPAAGREGPTILACSALRRAYRRVLDEGAPGRIAWVYLRGDPATIRARIDARSGHYMKSGLLESQFAALEEPAPGEALVVGIDADPGSIVDSILASLGPGPMPSSPDRPPDA